MKRKLAFLMALVLVLAFSSSAMAFTQTDANGTTNVTYTVSPSYTINIPADITVPATGTITDTQTVSVAAGYIIGKTQTLTINVASENDYKLQNGTSTTDTIVYTVKSSQGTSPETALSSINKQVLALVASEQTPVTSANLTFTIEKATNAGTYSDTLTFTAALTPAA